MASEKDIVAEARQILNASNAYTLRIQVRELLGALADDVERLRAGIRKTLEENGHLADGDNCTLIHLKRAIGED